MSRHRQRRRPSLGGIFRRSAHRDAPELPVPRRAVDPAVARGATVGRGHTVGDPRAPLQSAIERFNESDETRTVAGLIRSLGTPWVSVGAAAGSPTEIRITVAWELSWYQWGVEPTDRTKPVHPISKGREIKELDSGARHWNATVADGGRLRLGAGSAPRGPIVRGAAR